MSRFAHHNPEDPEAAMEALVERADFAKTQQREAAFGSFEWAKQVVANANAEREILAMSEPTGSPQLDQPTRSRERAALDIAVKRLRAINARAQGDGLRTFDKAIDDLMWIDDEARLALRCIADLCPEADIHGEPLRNTDRMP